MLKKKVTPVTVTNPYTLAKAKAQAALTMFTKAIDELHEANLLIQEKKQEDLEKILLLEKDINLAEKDINSNLKMIEKLKDFAPLSEEETA